MTESPASNRFAYWKRVLIGGLISALIAGLCVGLLLYSGGRPIRNVSVILFFMMLGFGLPAFIIASSGNVISIMAVIVFWFLLGTAITYFARKNMVAIGLWFVVYVISCAVTLNLFIQDLY